MSDLQGCSGWLHGVGAPLPPLGGVTAGSLAQGIESLILQDPNAYWDAGRRAVVSGSIVSPRVIALPVFAPAAFTGSASGVPPVVVKIVGFFVSHQTNGVVYGYLTGRSQLKAADVTARLGESALLSATFIGPGSPEVAGVPVEFLVNDTVVAVAHTDGTGTARPHTTSFRVESMIPGEYPGAIRVRLGEAAGFFTAEEAAANLTVRRQLPFITWPTPADITYGTPLGPAQLNATAEVPGTFSYAPGAGSVLPVNDRDLGPITATFVPQDPFLYEQNTATVFLTVRRAPLLLTVQSTGKFYLDPLPGFTFTAAPLVNGDTESVVSGTTTFTTTATASSPVGTYPVTFAGAVGAQNYLTTVTPGVLTILPRPTVTGLQAGTPSPSSYGQVVSFTVSVSSTVGVPTGGTVTLVRGDVPIAAGPVVDGRATINVSSLSAGNHPLSAQYAGAGGFQASFSPFVVHSVNRASTTTQLTSSVNPSRAGEPVTFTAVVNPVSPGAGVPTGSVEFLRAGNVVASVPLSNRTAALTLSTLAAGKHAIQARYVATVNYAGSVSGVVQQSVKGAGK